MKKKSNDEIRRVLDSVMTTEHKLDQYTLGWRAGMRWALQWVLGEKPDPYIPQQDELCETEGSQR